LLKDALATSDPTMVREGMPKGRLVPYVAAVVVVVGFGLLAWTSSKASSDDPQIRDAVRMAMLTDRPANCTVLYTRRLLEQTHGPSNPIAQCREEAGGTPFATSADVSAIRVSGTSATATVSARGGVIGGAVISFKLRKLGTWRLDRMTSIDIDLRRFARSQMKWGPAAGLPVREVSCVVHRTLARAGKSGIERALLTGRIDSLWAKSFDCVSDGTLRRIARHNFRQELEKVGTIPSIARCAADRAASTLSRFTLKAMMVASDPHVGQADAVTTLRGSLAGCESTYAGTRGGSYYPPAQSRAGPMTPRWRAFADSVDRVCAVDFNSAMAAQEQLEQLADAQGWNDRKAEAAIEHEWGEWQERTHSLTGQLGPPPAKPRLFAKWRANVGVRARLFHRAADAWLNGSGAEYNRVWARIDALKLRADRLGVRFGLRICTSNGPGTTTVSAGSKP
jgi:hypothetical protein